MDQKWLLAFLHSYTSDYSLQNQVNYSVSTYMQFMGHDCIVGCCSWCVYTQLCSGSVTLCSKDDTKRAQRWTRGPSRRSSVLTDWTTYVHVRACSMDQLLLCCMVVCAAMHTSGTVLAVGSRVPTGTVTVSIGRWTMAGSPIPTGWTTVCNIKQMYIYTVVIKSSEQCTTCLM